MYAVRKIIISHVYVRHSFHITEEMRRKKKSPNGYDRGSTWMPYARNNYKQAAHTTVPPLLKKKHGRYPF